MTPREVMARQRCQGDMCGDPCAALCGACLTWADHDLAALRDVGFVVVPREPTDEMVAAGIGRRGNMHPADCYRAMLAAAEEPPQSARY